MLRPFYLGVLFLFSSCGKTFLARAPYGSVNEDILYSTEKGAEGLLIAAYSNLDGFSGWDNGSPWGGAASNWVFGSMAGGDAYKGSEAGDQSDLSQFERHAVTPNDPFVDGKWRNYYDGISRVNQAIRAFANLKEISADKKNKRLAEATFLRAWFHFELWKIFRNIPFIDEKMTDVRVGNKVNVLPLIQSDLINAISGLPLQQSEPGRIKRGAAQSLLGHTYLWEKKWSLAKQQFDAVIASGVFKLNDNYHDNFNAATRNSKEGILEVQQSVNDGTTDNGNVGDVLNFPYNGGPAGCCGFHQPSQDLVNAFQTTAEGLPLLDDYFKTEVKSDDGLPASQPFTPYTGLLDPRLDWTVGRRGIPYLDWGLHPGSLWIRDYLYGGPYSPIKNVHYKSQLGTLVTASGWTSGYNANNIKLIRYADVLLQAAEAEVELGNLTQAQNYVNQVRRRAKNGSYVRLPNGNSAANYLINEYPGIWTDKDLARKCVRFERRIELGMEGHRFFDLVRWGIAAQERNAYLARESKRRTYLLNAVFTANKNEIYPLPVKALIQSYKDGVATMEQNPGY
ncbi:MAG: hypothetical protein RL732_356 [Bacteroidota bacterium]